MRSKLATAPSVAEVERLLLEACPDAIPLLDLAELELASLGEIEDDRLLDLPISIYSGG